MRQNETYPGLSPEQLKVLEHLATGCTVRKAAKLAGVNRTQIYRWKNESPAFEAAYTELVEALWASLKSDMRSMAGRAVKVLTDVLKSKDASNKDKLTAASLVLANLHKAMHDDELRKRVEELIAKMETLPTNKDGSN